MAKFYAGIDTERDTQVTRIGHRRLSSFVQTNDLRLTISANDEGFTVWISSGRYSNTLGKQGELVKIKNGKIIVAKDFADKILLTY